MSNVCSGGPFLCSFLLCFVWAEQFTANGNPCVKLLCCFGTLVNICLFLSRTSYATCISSLNHDFYFVLDCVKCSGPVQQGNSGTLKMHYNDRHCFSSSLDKGTLKLHYNDHHCFSSILDPLRNQYLWKSQKKGLGVTISWYSSLSSSPTTRRTVLSNHTRSSTVTHLVSVNRQCSKIK